MGCISSKRAAPTPPALDEIGEIRIKRSASHRRHTSASNNRSHQFEETNSYVVKKISPNDEEKIIALFDEENEERENERIRKKLKSSKSKSSSSNFSLNLKFGSVKSQVVAEQAAAGWPGWLTAVAGEAIHGWVPLRADGFEKLEKIGQGTYSSVFRAREHSTGRIVALKKVRFDNYHPESVRFMSREIMILRKLDHPNIMKLHGLITSKVSCSIYLVFDYMEHDLSGLVSSPQVTFTEAQGHKIHATIPQKFIWKHQSNVKEGAVYDLKNFNVIQNTGDYQTTQNPYKIKFTAKTTLKFATHTVIPHRPLVFTSFTDVAQNKIRHEYLIDVIGELHAHSVIELSSSNKRSMRIELVDDENVSLVCTLWEELADDMTSYISRVGQPCKHRIVIIRYMKIKPYKDSMLSNTICSRILFDPEIPEVREFIRRKIERGHMSSSSLTHLSSYSELVANELLDMSARRTIDELKETRESGYFVILATIKGFDNSYPWFAEFCSTCKGSVELDDEMRWICTGECNGYAKFVNLRYKVRVKVSDHTGETIFILFDSQANDLIKQTANNIRESQLKNGDADGIPIELNVLLERRFIFRIKIDEKFNLKMGWDSYGVNKLSEDNDLINRFINSTKLIEGNCLEVDSREESVMLDNKEMESIQSTCGADSGASTCNVTPCKRLSKTCEDDTQLSTTKKQVVEKDEEHGN